MKIDFLTARRMETLRLFVLGYSYKEIALAENVTYEVVRYELVCAKAFFGLPGALRSEVVRYCLDHNLFIRELL